MLTGQNGILNRATEAKEKTEEAHKQENETLNEYEKTFNKYMSNLPSTKYTESIKVLQKIMSGSTSIQCRPDIH